MSASADAAAAEDKRRTRDGLTAALIAYTLWGFFPIYFKIVAAVPPLEVLAHRIVWAVPFGLTVILVRRQWPEVQGAFRDRRKLAFLALAAAVISVNWLVYIFAVQTAHIFQASLGYYINPLMYVVIGVIFFRERLRRPQTAAVLLAAIGVTVLTISGGEPPLIALTLAISFTIYGVIRRNVVIGGMPGLFIETAILLPLAGAYLVWLIEAGASVFGAAAPSMSVTLMLAGPMTVLPLLCFALAARRLRFSTIGVLQFISPTLQFLVGIAYGEPLTLPHVICFALIWAAVFVFSWDAWRASQAVAPPAAAVPRPAAGAD